MTAILLETAADFGVRSAQVLAESVASFAIGVHFGYFGRQAATVPSRTRSRCRVPST